MANTRKAGRKHKPRFVQVAPKNPTIEQMTAALARGGLFIQRIEHDDGCKTMRTQRMADCTCNSIDSRLLRLAPDEQGGV